LNWNDGLKGQKILKILIKPWNEAQAEAFPIRSEVFIKEQGVPAELELDEFDPSAKHALAYQGEKCIGTGRLVHLGNGQAQIGRMAILAPFRGKGAGKLILSELMDLAKLEGASSLILHAQVAAMPFYEKLGFQAEGSSYEEAGIAHRNMILLLQK
jgi:predicted GNAT family N-acyltransferase